MKVLVACEESQRVCIAFREKGHEAYSCDVQDCSGSHPEWHIKGDVLPLLCEKWDLIIAHPPCTYLTCTGNRWFNIDKYGDKAKERLVKREEAADFFMKFANCDCGKIAIENPVGYMNTKYRKCDQIIHPYYFGDPYEKRTCLWLKGLPKLIPTCMVNVPDRIEFKSGKTMAKWYSDCYKLSPSDRSKARSKTFPGIAKAMVDQWG